MVSRRAVNGSVAAGQRVLHGAALDIDLIVQSPFAFFSAKARAVLVSPLASLAWSWVMHWLKVLDSPLPVMVNSHLPAAILSAARRGGVAARMSPQIEVKRRARLSAVVDFMAEAYTESILRPSKDSSLFEDGKLLRKVLLPAPDEKDERASKARGDARHCKVNTQDLC